MRSLAWIAVAMALGAAPGIADHKLVFSPPTVLSEEASQVPGGADPGGQANRSRLVALTKTPGGIRDGRLVAIYSDAGHPAGLVWHPDGGEHLALDVFARTSDDGGASWTNPVNISRTADKYSALTDWMGDGTPRPYWGDSGKPTVFSNGDNVVVSWVDKYVPAASWAFGGVGDNAVQGRAVYPDLTVAMGEREIPFSAVYAAVSSDGGTTWALGQTAPPLQLTYGRRDALQDVHRGIGDRWIMTWQEDPLGLQQGEGHGPGTGFSGAMVSDGTDVWYTFTTDIAGDPTALRTNRVPLSDNSVYNTMAANGYPIVGLAGSRSIQGASRCNLSLVKDGASFYATLAYEETKGAPGFDFGKTVQYHAFPFDTPTVGGWRDARYGAPGTTLSDPAENGRRVRFFTQGVTGIDPAIVIFWRQGRGAEAAPADIVLTCAKAVDPASLVTAARMNMSSHMPVAGDANLMDATDDDALENALAHRGFVRGSTIVFGCSYTTDGALARYTDLANYDFYIRRSLDGGLTWDRPRNVTRLGTTRVSVKEPRIVPTPNTGKENGDVFVVAWATETNVYEGLGEPEPLDIFVRHTWNLGETYSRAARVGDALHREFECQLRVNEAGDEVDVVWMSEGSPTEALFATATPKKISSSSGSGSWSCAAQPDAPVDPILIAGLVLGVLVLWTRTRRARSCAPRT